MRTALLLVVFLLAGCNSPSKPVPTSAVSVEEGSIYLSPPQHSHGFELGIDFISASLKRTFSDRTRVYPLQPQGWRVDLQLWVKETQRTRISRIGGPIRIVSARDEFGRELPVLPSSSMPTRDERNVFVSGGEERRDLPPRHATGLLFPKQLPQRLSVIRGVVPVEVAEKTDTVEVIMDEEKQVDLGNGMTVIVRPITETAKTARVVPVNVVIQCRDSEWPILKSVFTTGPDRRIRDMGNGSFESLPDGTRQWTFNTAIDRSRSEIRSIMRIERVLSTQNLEVEFEFTNVPVGAER